MKNYNHRHEALEPLSKEHHYALQVCSRIRKGLGNNVDKDRIRKYIDWFERSYLDPHFEVEEQVIFRTLGKNARVRKALANHRRIKRLLSCGCENEKVLNLLEEELGTYIRFEERVLYDEVQRVVSPEKLAEIKKHHDRIKIPVDDWKDRFWED